MIVNRTNNPLERFNRTIQDRMQRIHPNVVTFTSVIKEISNEYVERLDNVRNYRAAPMERHEAFIPALPHDWPAFLESAQKAPATTKNKSTRKNSTKK